MKVYAVHEVTRASVALYVELEQQPDGGRLYLTTGAAGDEVVQVAPCAEPPAFVRLGLHLAVQVADALKAEPSIGYETVTLETWREFVELVERVTGQDAATS